MLVSKWWKNLYFWVNKLFNTVWQEITFIINKPWNMLPSWKQCEWSWESRAAQKPIRNLLLFFWHLQALEVAQQQQQQQQQQTSGEKSPKSTEKEADAQVEPYPPPPAAHTPPENLAVYTITQTNLFMLPSTDHKQMGQWRLFYYYILLWWKITSLLLHV